MRSMDTLILSIAIAVTLGLAACTKDSDNGGEQPPEEASKLEEPGALPRPPANGKVPADLKPPR